jgi:predicted DCC family thiol-disulfide oxidoreductase YuxK
MWLDGWWWAVLARVLLLVPRPMRNYVYGIVAQTRYRIWGRNTACALPPQWLHRRIVAAPIAPDAAGAGAG